VYADPLLDLVTRYDASRVQIGYVRLSDGVAPIESYLRVGEVEADPLVVDPATGEVFARDHAAPCTPCASTRGSATQPSGLGARLGSRPGS
jgi:hypothetical protein